MHSNQIRQRKKNLVGQKFGRLSPLSESGRNKHGSVLWKCICDCGQIVVRGTSLLTSGDCRSCGCLAVEVKRSAKKHGHTIGKKATPEFTAWKNMHSRCEISHHRQFKNYGARGITVCERWKDFRSFIDDVGLRPSRELSLHRINNNLGYIPSNVKWATSTEQMSNTRRNHYLEFKGQIKTMTSWCEELGISFVTVYCRLKKGWTVDEALGTPVGNQRKVIA